MLADVSSFAATIAASGIGTLLAAALSYRYALAKFKRERGYDRQLAWYEKATGSLLAAASKLNWAIAADRSGVDSDGRAKAWNEAIDGLLGLRALEVEAEIYASSASYAALRAAVDDVMSISSTVPVIRRAAAATTVPSQGQLYEVVSKMLMNAASRLASDARSHLELEPVTRELRLYDEEYRQLQAELAEHKRLGRDFGEQKGSADTPS